MLRFSIALMLGTALAGCAKRPDAIAPATIPIEAYSNMSCANLASAYTVEKARLAGLSAEQNSAATGDAVGVFLIGVPTSSLFGGDKEGAVAVAKGKVTAMESAAAAKKCTLPKTD